MHNPHEVAVTDELTVHLVRSERRKKTVAARLVGNVLKVMVPAGMTAEQEQGWVEKMRGRLTKTRDLAETTSDEELGRRARQLAQRYLPGQIGDFSIRYVANQDHRFGSCTPSTRRIRLSHRLAKMPTWVLDYVIVHELAHLIQANHSKKFWRLVNRYPKTERARGFLMAKGLEDPDTAPDDLEQAADHKA